MAAGCTLVDLLIDAGRLDEAMTLIDEGLDEVTEGDATPETVVLDERSVYLIDRLLRTVVEAQDGELIDAWMERLASEEASLDGELARVVAAVLQNRGIALIQAGRFDEAQRALEDALERAIEGLGRRLEVGRRVRGSDHAGTAEWSGSLGRMYVATGLPAEAVPLLEASVEVLAAQRGDGHPSTQQSLRWLVRALDEVGRGDAADELRGRVVSGAQ